MAEFSIDAACIGVFPAAAYDAFSTLDRADDGPSAFDWVSEHIPQIAHFACTLSIPQSETPCFIASTGSDGGYAAAALLDAEGRLSEVLIDIAGRASDRCFIDKLLPAPPTRPLQRGRSAGVTQQATLNSQGRTRRC